MTIAAGQILNSVFSLGDSALAQLADTGKSPAIFGVTGAPTLARHRVYNLEIEGLHTYIAGGIRVHNTSILNFLSPSDLAHIVPGSLDDLNNDGSLDYVEIDNGLGGTAASGSTIYKMELSNGQYVGRAYVTHADTYGRLVQTQYDINENGEPIEGTLREIVLTGADFGYQAGAILTPYLAAALLDENASVFERLAVTTIAGTFLSNVFEFAGGAIHDQIVSHGLQNGTLDDIASITFADFGDELITNGVDNAVTLLTQWVMAEVFEGLNTDTLGGKFASLLLQEGVNYIANLAINVVATDVLNLSDVQIAKWGLTAGEFNQIFSGPNLLNLLFKAAIGTVLPGLESTEAQIGSSLITLALDIFAGIGGLLGAALGYVGGLILDFIFDKDPQALSGIVLDTTTGELRIGVTSSADGGKEAVSKAMAAAFADFFNDLMDTASARSTNLSGVLAAKTYTFGHIESTYIGVNGAGFGTGEAAVVKSIGDALAALVLSDGDLKIAKAVADFVAPTAANAASALREFQMKVQIASDYQHYLENQETYDALIAADTGNAFAVGWAQTFLLAEQYGLTAAMVAIGTSGSNTFLASSGNDSIDGGAGDDSIHGYSGIDTLRGGDGNDKLFGGAGNDRLYGDAGDDSLFAGSGTDTLYGGTGLDSFYVNEAGSGRSTVYGGADADMVTFGRNRVEFVRIDAATVEYRIGTAVYVLNAVEFVRFKNDVVALDPAYNQIVGSAKDDLLTGTELADAINSLAGDDIVYGLGGDDFISGGVGSDSLFGGAGNDWIFGVRGNDLVRGGIGNDVLYGGADDDAVWGDEDQDRVYGEAGDDVLAGGTGNDLLDGLTSDDLMDGGAGNDTLYGGAGDDDLYGVDGIDTLDGGGGDDLLDGGAANDTLTGGDADDVIYGGAGTNILYGGKGPGNGGTGDDVLYGGINTDSIFGGWGDDLAYGGDGNDFIYAITGSAAATPFSPGTQLTGQTSGTDQYSDWGFDVAYGGNGNDVIGVTGSDIAFGGAGDDTFYAYELQSRIDGGAGNDTIKFTSTNFMDAQWFRSTSGQTAAILWHNNSSRGHEGTYHYIDVVNIERIINKEYTTKILTFGFSFYTNGTGSAKYDTVKNLGYTAMTDAAFAARFSEAAFLNRQYIDYAADPSDWNAIRPITTVQNLTTGNDIVDETNANLIGRQRINGLAGNDILAGKSGADQLWGDLGLDTLYGGSGNDMLDGGDGGDNLNGDSGADTIYAGTGFDNVYGGSGDDSINGSWGEDDIYGGSGHDQIDGEEHNDNLYGGDGHDTIWGGTGLDTIYGGNSHDSIYGEESDDTIFGENGGDLIDGGTGGDSLYGGLGADILRGQDGADSLYGGDAQDSLVGGADNDYLSGDSSHDIMDGGLGDDILDGGSGNDSLQGGDGNDTLTGSNGYDLVYGGVGDDLFLGGSEGDAHYGGTGIDTINYAGSAGAIRADLGRGEGFDNAAAGDIYSNIENVIGSALADRITGSTAANTIYGGTGGDSIGGAGGNDTLYGGNGTDRLDAGTGDDDLFGDSDRDTLTGGSGNDALDGGDGDDSLVGGSDNDILIGGLGIDRLAGGIGNDTLRGDDGDDDLSGNAGIDRLYGGIGGDMMRGDTGNDSLYGEAGDDQMFGGDGNDLLDGGDGADALVADAGNDTLYGGLADDILTGGAGNDTLYGGAGIDVFLIGQADGSDIIKDFADGVDRLGLLPGVYEALVFADTGGTRIQMTGATSVLLEGITVGQITAADFLVGLGSVLTFKTPILGTAIADTLNGTTGRDVIFGLDGNDRINTDSLGDVAYGGIGSDGLYGATTATTLYGGDGTDSFYSGAGADQMVGDGGTDYARYAASTAGVTVDLASNTGSGGFAQGDTFDSIESVYASNHADFITGDRQANRLWTYGGDDVIYGGEGNDDLDGGVGNDTLRGGEGDDLIRGGTGNDMLTGNAGADRFVFSAGVMGNDTIQDFNQLDGNDREGDVLAFEALLVGVFAYRGAAAFTGGSDNSEARVTGTTLQVDANGDGVTDISVVLSGLSAANQLNALDFAWT